MTIPSPVWFEILAGLTRCAPEMQREKKSVSPSERPDAIDLQALAMVGSHS
jgi:hypothetical protein